MNKMTVVGPRPKQPGPVPRGLEDLSRWTDSAFRIPGLGWRFGWDALIGLIPGLGDTITSLLSLYILAVAARQGVSRGTVLRMAMNVAIDYLVGAIPFIGDLFDVYWKANQRNVTLLERRLSAPPDEARKAGRGDWLFAAGLIIGLIALLALSIALALWLLTAVVEGLSSAWHRGR